MMYAELIKALRRCSYMTVAEPDREDGYCKPCAYYTEDSADVTCIDRMMIDAADAIEADEQRIAELEAQMPKEGEWIPVDDGMVYVKCSVCGDVMCCRGHYCPNCGARMRKGERNEK